MALLEKPDGVSPPLLPGVWVTLGVLRYGDSGRDRDVPRRGLVLAPGPTDCENFGIAGVLGAKAGFAFVERLKLAYEGVVGVGGNSSEVLDARLDARWTGRKMPEPGTEVVK